MWRFHSFLEAKDCVHPAKENRQRNGRWADVGVPVVLRVEDAWFIAIAPLEENN